MSAFSMNIYIYTIKKYVLCVQHYDKYHYAFKEDF